MSDLAKLFWNGRSQAVRLPMAYRFEGDQVRISREGRRIYLTPVDAIEGVDAISAAAADALDQLRGAIRDGLASGAPEPIDMDDIKARARDRFERGE